MSVSVPSKPPKSASGETIQLLAPGFSSKVTTSASNQEVEWPLGTATQYADAIRITCDGDLWIRFGTTGQAASATLGVPFSFWFQAGTEMFSRPPGVTHINFLETGSSVATTVAFTAMG